MRTTIRWIIGHLSVWGRYRPRVSQRIPRAIPEDLFDKLFAALSSDPGPGVGGVLEFRRGCERRSWLGVRECDVDPGQQLITVVRKGTRAVEQVPASADAFVWLRLYQEQVWGEVPLGRTQPLWWTLRKPRRPLNYHAAHRMFERANATLGSDWTLHDLRHSAARRMANDPHLSLVEVKEVLGHAHLSTTEIYLTPDKDEVIASVLAHHARTADQREHPRTPPPPPAPGYDPAALSVLFGRSL